MSERREELIEGLRDLAWEIDGQNTAIAAAAIMEWAEANLTPEDLGYEVVNDKWPALMWPWYRKPGYGIYTGQSGATGYAPGHEPVEFRDPSEYL